jgi:nicotinamide riboside transporter PnuC
MLPLILFVLLPALLMLLWVWANDAQQQNRYHQSRPVHWASRRLLSISQRTGWVAVIIVVACRLFLL